MHLCPQELVAIAEMLLVAAIPVGLVGIAFMLLVRDDGWTFSDKKSPRSRELLASGVSLLTTTLGVAGTIGGLAARAGQNVWLALSLLIAGIVLISGVICAVLQGGLIRYVHWWLGQQEELTSSEPSAKALMVQNRHLEDLMARRHFAILGALGVALILAIWTGVEGRCDQADSAVPTPGVQTDSGVSDAGASQ